MVDDASILHHVYNLHLVVSPDVKLLFCYLTNHVVLNPSRRGFWLNDISIKLKGLCFGSIVVLLIPVQFELKALDANMVGFLSFFDMGFIPHKI